VRLRIRSGGLERRVIATVSERPRAPAADSAALPILMLDTGGRVAAINGLAFTPDGKQIVSAGDDKVVRVWDWETGKAVRTIRGQVGVIAADKIYDFGLSPYKAAAEGRIYAVALSPDGQWLAVGGYIHAWRGLVDESIIRIHNFSTGRPVALLYGHHNVVECLAFSPDGKRLISGSSDHTAIVWDIENRKLLYRLEGHSAKIRAVAFLPDGGRAITASDDKLLKLWSTNTGRTIATLKGHGGEVSFVAVSPVDGSIASATNIGEVRTWNGMNGKFLGSMNLVAKDQVTKGVRISGLSFSRDGQIAPVPALSPDARYAALVGQKNGIAIYDARTGEKKQGLVGVGSAVVSVGSSQDGQSIAWGATPQYSSHNDRGPIEFHIQLPSDGKKLGLPQPFGKRPDESVVRARSKFGPYALVHRKGGSHGYDALLELWKNGKPQAGDERGPMDGYTHHAYTFSPDGETILSGGGHGVLTAHKRTGQFLGDFVGHDGDVWAVAVSPDGRFLVSGGNDQTVRLWSMKTRKLIVSLFHGDNAEWLMWTPEGYYTGSPGADKIVGWQINKGPENAADYVGADQLREHLNRPDIVEKAIILASAEQAVREAPGTSFKLSDLLARPVPRFKIVSPAEGSKQSGGRLSVKIAIAVTPDPIRSISAQVNGRQVAEETPAIGSGGFGAGERFLYLPLAKGRNQIRISLTNAIGEKAEILTVVHDEEGDLDKRGTLHILAIGVDKYPGLGMRCGPFGKSSCDLNFAGADARKLAEAIEARLGPVHTDVAKRVVVNDAPDPNDEPTAVNILDAVGQLRKATEKDTVAVFISGHGINEGASYRFLPTNAAWDGDGDLLRNSTVVSWHILQEAVETAKGRRIMFVDTCHSGNAYNQRLSHSAYHANIIAYTATRFDQLASESTKLKHGLFTYAVAEGLGGKASRGDARQITTKDLADYVVARVGELAKEIRRQQEPQYFKGRDAQDFVLARW
jgi:WD40 repeat protein